MAALEAGYCQLGLEGLPLTLTKPFIPWVLLVSRRCADAPEN